MEQERSHYTYRQSVRIEEFASGGGRPGEYREVRDVIFSPSGERTEKFIGKPVKNLVRLGLTDEDFRDIREVQPFVLSQEQARLYESRYKGEETIDGNACFVLEVKPRQILQDQRLFEGLLWATQDDFSVIRMQGRAVPQHLGKSENLFPRFTTVRERVDGFWFPALTAGDDTLPFRAGPIRMKLTIRYSDYKRFGAESKVTFK